MRDKLQELDGGGDWRAMLRARVLRNCAAVRDDTGSRGLSLRIPRKRPSWLIPPVSWVVTVRDYSPVTLDALGTEVWTLCDGRRTVEDLIDAFAAKHGLSFHEARVAVTQYLKVLIQRGVLAVELADASKEPVPV